MYVIHRFCQFYTKYFLDKQYVSLQQLTLDVFMQYCDVYVAMGCISGSWVEEPFVAIVKSVTTS